MGVEIYGPASIFFDNELVVKNAVNPDLCSRSGWYIFYIFRREFSGHAYEDHARGETKSNFRLHISIKNYYVPVYI